MTTQIPAERTVDGVGLQRVHAIDPRTGEYSHLVMHRGTVEQARAKAELGFWHPTDARWHELRAIILSE